MAITEDFWRSSMSYTNTGTECRIASKNTIPKSCLALGMTKACAPNYAA